MIINIPTGDSPVEQPSPNNQGGYYAKRRFLTITEITNFARCPRRYFYSAGCGFRRTDESLLRRDTAAHYGVAIGNAVPEWLSTGDFERCYTEFLRVWGDHVEDETRNKISAKITLFNFAQAHPAPNRGLYSILPPPAGLVNRQELKSQWEIPFAIDIGLDIPLIGSIDYWSQYNHDGTKWVNEIKTSREMSDRFARGFKRNPQGLAYTLAARVYDKSVAGYIMELIGTAKNPKNPIIMQPVNVTDHDLNVFIGWAREMGQKILECERTGEWPLWPSGCGTYPMFYQPGYFCEYDPLCSVPDWTTMTQFYNVKRHEPYTLPTVNGQQIVGMKDLSAGDE